MLFQIMMDTWLPKKITYFRLPGVLLSQVLFFSVNYIPVLLFSYYYVCFLLNLGLGLCIALNSCLYFWKFVLRRLVWKISSIFLSCPDFWYHDSFFITWNAVVPTRSVYNTKWWITKRKRGYLGNLLRFQNSGTTPLFLRGKRSIEITAFYRIPIICYKEKKRANFVWEEHSWLERGGTFAVTPTPYQLRISLNVEYTIQQLGKLREFAAKYLESF